jgi:hypothetical protein
MDIHMRITQHGELIADLPRWSGPVPRTGDYIFHPPTQEGAGEPHAHSAIAGCVRTVTWRTHDRGPRGFVQTDQPYVEITL